MNSRKVAWFLAILAFFIFVGSPFGQSAKAVVVVDDAILLIILAALAAMGITFTMTGGIETVKEWLQNEIFESGISFAGVRYGANSSGNILMNNIFVKRIAALASYLRIKYSLANGTSVTVLEQSISLGQITVYPGNLFQFEDKDIPDRGIGWRTDMTVFTIYLTRGGSTIFPLLYDDGRFTVQVHSYGSLSNPDWNTAESALEYSQTDFYYVVGMNFNPNNYRGTSNLVVYNYSVEDMLELVSGEVQTQKEELIVNSSVLDIPSDQDIGDDGAVLTLPVPWGQTLPETLEEVPGLVLGDELEGETSIELENESEIEDQLSETATNGAGYVSDNPAEYQVIGLQNVFPFCIPFDIYAFFECLAADPVAPVVNWRFYVPDICDETITIDLSQFNTVAQIVRTMELLAFIVGLALVTREKFLRG